MHVTLQLFLNLEVYVYDSNKNECDYSFRIV